MPKADVLIVGAGLAGLCCARHLQDSGVDCQLVEQADRVGGRVWTDQVDGFLLDRGFQVFLTAYPEARRMLDYDRLDLKKFEPGALVRFHGKFHRFVDPWRRPRHLFATALSPVASVSDKLRVARLRRRLCRRSIEQLYSAPETTTTARLREQGFSDQIVERFFRPFLGGVFLEPKLATSSRMFEFVFQMFSRGDAALPANGMHTIPQQLAENMAPDSLRTRTAAKSVAPQRVVLESGEEIRARAVVLATAQPAAARLTGSSEGVTWNGVCCLYYAANRPPIEEPLLVLNGDGSGPVNNLCVPSQVSDRYAPPGKSLVSVTVLGTAAEDEKLDVLVRQQLDDWFGSQVAQWQHLRTCRVDYALPRQSPPALSPVEKQIKQENGLFLCGDYLDTASINGAMASGRRAARAVMDTLNGKASV